MRTLILLLLLLALASALLLAQAPPVAASAPPAAPEPSQPKTADWNRVGSLVHDQPVIVSARGGRNLHCLFTGATGTTLFCDPPLYRQYEGEYHLERADIETIRLDQAHRNMKIAIWSFAAAGFALGAADNHLLKQGSPRVVDGIAGGLVGAMGGLVVSVPAALLIPGKLVYARPRALPAASAPTPAP
jgi:hypothetical protein